MELEAYEVARIRDVLTDITYHSDLETWHVNIRCLVETALTGSAPLKAKLTAELTLSNQTRTVDSLVDYKENKRSEIEVVASLMVKAVSYV